jgi:hypothetical protein
VVNTPKRKPPFRQMKFEGSPTARSASTAEAPTGEASSSSTSQVSTPRDGGSSSIFRMEGYNPTIRLPEFQGESTKDRKNNFFICAKIWEEK